MTDLSFKTKPFNELSTSELYKILRLRAEVFIVEQDCVYQDIDDKDSYALHVIGYKGNEIIAYARLFNTGDYFDKASIGRVVISEKERKFGYGHMLIQNCIAEIEKHFTAKEILISAQCYLISFYKKHGFNEEGEGYLEDGIPHIKMQRA